MKNPINIEDIEVNYTTCQRLLATTGVRVSRDAVGVFQNKLKKYAITIIDEAKKRAEETKSKTLNPIHII